MTHAELRDRLNDYVDGVLASRERVEIDGHLEQCQTCRDKVEDLHGLLESLTRLPKEVYPARDLWEGVEEGIEKSGAVPLNFRRNDREVSWRRRSMMAAAAVLLMAVSSAFTAWWIGRTADEALLAERSDRTRRFAVAVSSAQFEVTYGNTVQELTELLHRRRDYISPETCAVIERNLMIIDEAISVSREALLADPGNQELMRKVSSMYAKKVALLQQAAELPSGS